jgi:AraC-like DNA-binding protein
MTEPTVCVKALRAPFFTAAARTGLPVPMLAGKVDVPLNVLTDVTARVPHSTAIRVWETFAAECSEPSFGMVAAEFAGAAPLDLVDFALTRAPSLRALLKAFLRYQTLFHDANAVELLEERDVLHLRHGFAGDLARSRLLGEFILATWVSRTRAVAGVPLRPRLVRFRHGPPPDIARHQAVFGEVEFGADRDEMVISTDALDAPFAHGDEAASSALARQLDEELAKAKPASFADRVRAHAVAGIRGGALDIDVIAKALASSRRTLQRRLNDEGTSFRNVVDEARREVALDVMARGGTTVTDLTFLLGFSDLSAFGRAFRRWTGTNPASYLRAKSA